MLCPMLSQVRDRKLRKLKRETWASNVRLRCMALIARARMQRFEAPG